MIAIIATAIACFVVGGILSYVLFRYVLKSKYDSVLKDAETEAEVIKKNKLLEVKEKFLNKAKWCSASVRKKSNAKSWKPKP